MLVRLESVLAIQMKPYKEDSTYFFIYHVFWANYSDLSRRHLKWWFSKGIPPKLPLIQVQKL